MRRRSERGKIKPTKEDSPEKPPEKPSRSSRHSRRRRKSSSSSDSESKGSSKNIESSNSISQPLAIEVPKVETIPEESKAVAPVNSEVTNNTTENPEMPNREDASDGNSKEKEESLWKVQSANGAGDGGEIQKLKICRQRPTESPEIGDTALRRRLGRNAKESRSTDDSTQEESEKESKKSKHRPRTSSKNSPMVSPTVVCDVSGDSPTKIKIINVSHLNTDSKSGVTKPSGDKNIEDEEQVKKSEQNDVKTQEVDLANISLPETETPLPPVEMKDTSLKKDPVEVSDKTIPERRSSKDTLKSEGQTVKSIVEVESKIEKDEGGKPPPEKRLSPVPSPKKDLPKPDSSGNSESSEDESKPRRVKKKRRRDLQSSVLRRFSGSTSPKQESSDSEEDIQKKKEADRRESTDKQEPHVKDTVKDEKAEEAPLPKVTKTTVEESSIVEVQQPMPRKRRWGSSKANRPEKSVSISTDILKSLIPDAKPVAADELQLSVEEEEGQLMDDDDEEDVVVLMAKEEEKQLELERLKEEKQREREKEEEERRKKRQERQERFEKKKQGETLANKVEKEKDGLKTLLSSEDGITVVEADMKEAMEQFQNDPAVAFAHCISRDFDCNKQMSAGVAVVFRNHFGKPKFSDALSEYLTCQIVKDGAVVYGLVTKSQYFEKPSRQDYDKAFKFLTEDFLKKKLKRLICSPMGCVRDRIPLKHFARCIFQFQADTKACISIITCDESNKRALRNGLTHDDFVMKLRNIFAELKRNAEEANNRSVASLLGKGKHEDDSSPQISDDAPRKILLLSDDVKKVSRPPTPPRRKPTSVLYITHLVRPFTVQQLKNLLLRTGTIAENGFWIDKIKSKCYVEYTTEDAAVETRHALHGVKWPTSNPKTLVVEFASQNDLAAAQVLSEESEQPRKPEPLNMVEGWVADQARIRDGSRRTIVREWDVGKPEHPDEALEYELKMKEKEKKELERKMRKERHHRTPSPETDHHARKARKKDDAPAKLLDDLFKKTKSSPCIYWLPLTQEQIAVKEEMRRQHMAEHERRLAEIKKADQARRDRERRSRK